MKNITISMDDELAQATRVAAAKEGKSVSRFMAEAAREKLRRQEPRKTEGKSNPQLEALKRIWAGPKWDVTIDGRMPTAEERNARR
jgi:plasmid stability protein